MKWWWGYHLLKNKFYCDMVHFFGSFSDTTTVDQKGENVTIFHTQSEGELLKLISHMSTKKCSCWKCREFGPDFLSSCYSHMCLTAGEFLAEKQKMWGRVIVCGGDGGDAQHDVWCGNCCIRFTSFENFK